jgi:LmbE family N-acetylglucosaminyl deacetylase
VGKNRTRPARALPRWQSVLAVVAHPDDEAFGLGAVISDFVAAGGSVHLLVLTRGESSTLGAAGNDLVTVRPTELARAAAALRLASFELAGYPDASLTDVPTRELIGRVASAAHSHDVDGLLVFDRTGVTGHPDHVAATRAALAFAAQAGLPVLGWTLPVDIASQLNQELGCALVGRAPDEIDLRLQVDRTCQLQAAAAHSSQGSPVLWRRLELLAGSEYLVWLHQTAAAEGFPATGRGLPARPRG